MTDFDEYIRQSEPIKKEKARNWQMAIGLQKVDGLKPSDFLIQIAIQNIEGEITMEEAINRIDAHYETLHNRIEKRSKDE